MVTLPASITTTPERLALSPEIVLSGPASTGNRCDHDPKNPRLELDFTPTRRGKLPAVLQQCIENLQAYYFDRSILRPLAELDASDKKVTAGKRSNRSEAREAEVLVISAILQSLDLTSMLVGVPVNGKFIHRSTYELAKMAGLLDPVTDEPHRRFTRCLSRIRRSGMMDTTRTTFKTQHGTVRAGIAIKKVSYDFIVMLMGGDPKAAARLEKARTSHYKATLARRAKGSAPTKAEHRDVLAEKLIAQAKQKAIETAQAKAAKEGATPAAIDALDPESKQRAYNKARSEHQKRLLDQGLDFAALHAQMKAFPTFDNWAV
ncbi:hypothetical protein [Aeromonas phage 85AhydR10PP]|nr:hypothetical protein [Aeromonas phage 85AhydR10PP]